jgi:DDB1- and CUL4-associated factor 11
MPPCQPSKNMHKHPTDPSSPQAGHAAPLDPSGRPVISTTRHVFLREAGLGRAASASGVAHFACHHRLPARPANIADAMHSRGYIGQFTADGEVFVAAYQNERRIRMYDVHRGWRLAKDVHARNLRWTVTDVALSSDQAFLLYASITPVVHLVKVAREGGEAVESVANVTGGRSTS